MSTKEEVLKLIQENPMHDVGWYVDFFKGTTAEYLMHCTTLIEEGLIKYTGDGYFLPTPFMESCSKAIEHVDKEKCPSCPYHTACIIDDAERIEAVYKEAIEKEAQLDLPYSEHKEN
jgi:hypothetical protein